MLRRKGGSMVTSMKRVKKAPRSVPLGSPKVPKLVENGNLVIPTHRGIGRKRKAKPSRITQSFELPDPFFHAQKYLFRGIWSLTGHLVQRA